MIKKNRKCYQKQLRNLIILDQELNAEKKEFEELRTSIGEEKNACVKVSNSAYVGTKLMFGDLCMFLKEKYDYCQFRKEGGDIRSVPL